MLRMRVLRLIWTCVFSLSSLSSNPHADYYGDVIWILQSLERMTLSLARDKLHYTPEQMAALSQQIRVGDLTPVMQIYEDDIRSPLKSAVGGTLVRTLLVQVQKAKVLLPSPISPTLYFIRVAADTMMTRWT